MHRLRDITKESCLWLALVKCPLDCIWYNLTTHSHTKALNVECIDFCLEPHRISGGGARISGGGAVESNLIFPQLRPQTFDEARGSRMYWFLPRASSNLWGGARISGGGAVESKPIFPQLRPQDSLNLNCECLKDSMAPPPRLDKTVYESHAGSAPKTRRLRPQDSKAPPPRLDWNWLRPQDSTAPPPNIRKKWWQEQIASAPKTRSSAPKTRSSAPKTRRTKTNVGLAAIAG